MDAVDAESQPQQKMYKESSRSFKGLNHEIDLYRQAANEEQPRYNEIKWVNKGPAQPSTGREIDNEKLAKALSVKTEFTAIEWDMFGITDLRVGDFILSDKDYFQPEEGFLVPLERSDAPSQSRSLLVGIDLRLHVGSKAGEQAVVVSKVYEGSPAAEFGFRDGDVIVNLHVARPTSSRPAEDKSVVKPRGDLFLAYKMLSRYSGLPSTVEVKRLQEGFEWKLNKDTAWKRNMITRSLEVREADLRKMLDKKVKVRQQGLPLLLEQDSKHGFYYVQRLRDLTPGLKWRNT
eukprot:6197521-Prymnesium_polylepis.1